MDDGFHTATFSSLHQLRHDELFIEPHKQLRREQPLERYEVLLQHELENRKMQENEMAKIPAMKTTSTVLLKSSKVAKATAAAKW